MARLLAIVALLATAAGPALAGAADDVYSYVDADGVIHVTNVPQDGRYRRAGTLGRVRATPPNRVAVASRRVPPLLARDTTRYDEHIRVAAEKYGVPSPLVKAVMAAESNFNPAAVSGKGARGLMQLMPETARDMYVYDVHDPAQNIEGGARYLRLLHDRYGGDLVKVLAAYNAGPEAVRRSGGAVPRIPETQAYVRKVLALYQAFKAGK